MNNIELQAKLRFTNNSMTKFCEALEKTGLPTDEFVELAVMLLVNDTLFGS